jgi:hypothetical protein
MIIVLSCLIFIEVFILCFVYFQTEHLLKLTTTRFPICVLSVRFVALCLKFCFSSHLTLFDKLSSLYIWTSVWLCEVYKVERSGWYLFWGRVLPWNPHARLKIIMLVLLQKSWSVGRYSKLISSAKLPCRKWDCFLCRPWRHERNMAPSPVLRNLGIKWRWVVSFTSVPH